MNGPLNHYTGEMEEKSSQQMKIDDFIWNIDVVMVLLINIHIMVDLSNNNNNKSGPRDYNRSLETVWGNKIENIVYSEDYWSWIKQTPSRRQKVRR